MNQDSTNGGAACDECGAPRVDGMTCSEQLGLLLAWEYDDPALAAQHFLTVTSYNLQHPAQFADEALTGLQAMFVEHLDNRLAVQEIRRRIGQTSAGSRRVLRPAAERRPRLRGWRMTIANVYLPDQPDGAAVRVQAWAESIRNEM